VGHQRLLAPSECVVVVVVVVVVVFRRKCVVGLLTTRYLVNESSCQRRLDCGVSGLIGNVSPNAMQRTAFLSETNDPSTDDPFAMYIQNKELTEQAGNTCRHEKCRQTLRVYYGSSIGQYHSLISIPSPPLVTFVWKLDRWTINPKLTNAQFTFVRHASN
jgi:hypothetical protein